MKIKSGKIVISDPCYEIDIDGCLVVDARNGNWSIEVTEYEKERGRISKLVAVNSSRDVVRREYFDCGVDSGQMSIVDANEYRRDSIAVLEGEPLTGDSMWYDMCCEKTLSSDNCGNIPNGFVTSTGYGDGCYEAEVGFDSDDKAVSISIVFIDEFDYCTDCGASCDESDLWNGICEDCQEEDMESCVDCGDEFESSELNSAGQCGCEDTDE